MQELGEREQKRSEKRQDTQKRSYPEVCIVYAHLD